MNNDAIDDLALELYGRKAMPREIVGGSNARIIRDAVLLIRELREDSKTAQDVDTNNQD